ncbi:acyl-CoA dehydrogenase family protein [Brevibacillus humidisoli]|uniref:acyl-CoA dehydrogenase family protein n=1 Tax=Brevibacillus humidisoli TaxID=2895522 RepID=UPI001E411961|nr:acyl-CoA dehydrogenase family protein [Brevibacillus humidisoli]UFJ42479.1 acyl-CoA dehydrogenase family protein [Brevibacillus humidisoli]
MTIPALSLAEQLLQLDQSPAALHLQLQQELARMATVAEPPLYLYGTDRPGHFVSLLPVNGSLSDEQWYVSGSVRCQMPIKTIREVTKTAFGSCVWLEAGEAVHVTRLSADAAMTHHHNLRYLLLAGVMIDALRSAAEVVAAYSRSRKAFGVVLNRHHLIQRTLVEAAGEYTANSLLLYDLAERVDLGHADACQSMEEVRQIAWSQVETIDRLAPVHGALGVTEESPLSGYREQLHRWAGLVRRMVNLSEVALPGEANREWKRGDDA